jgi:hypothetical protein
MKIATNRIVRFLIAERLETRVRIAAHRNKLLFSHWLPGCKKEAMNCWVRIALLAGR